MLLLLSTTYHSPTSLCNDGRYVGYRSLPPSSRYLTRRPTQPPFSPRRHPAANSGPAAAHALAKDTTGGDTTRAKVTRSTTSNGEASRSPWPWGRSSSLLRLVRNGYTVAQPVRAGSTHLAAGHREMRAAAFAGHDFIFSS